MPIKLRLFNTYLFHTVDAKDTAIVCSSIQGELPKRIWIEYYLTVLALMQAGF